MFDNDAVLSLYLAVIAQAHRDASGQGNCDPGERLSAREFLAELQGCDPAEVRIVKQRRGGRRTTAMSTRDASTEVTHEKEGYMSLYDYEVSRRLERQDPPFDALIMAAMRRANASNLDKLRAEWPAVWEELCERSHTPGARLPGQQDEVREGLAAYNASYRELTREG